MKTMDKPEVRFEFGPYGVELIPCHETPLLAGLSASYATLKAAVAEVERCKSKVGLLRGKLPKANQHRETAPSISNITSELGKHYAFAAARTELEVSLLPLERARTALGLFLQDSVMEVTEEGVPLECDGEFGFMSHTNRWMLKDVGKDAPHAIKVVTRHNIAATSAVLYWLIEKLPDYRRYLKELPDYCEILWIGYRSHQDRLGYQELWQVMVHGAKS